MFYDRFTRFLHFLFAFGIVAQLLTSEWMVHPKPDRAANFLYEIHEKLGVALLVVLVIHWLWSLVRRGPVPFGQVFPWASATRRAALWQDIKHYLASILKLRLPGVDEPSPLAGAIQGVGLVIATVMAATGTLIFFNIGENGQFSSWLALVKEVHEFFGPVLWAYLVVHVGASVLHEILGHRIIHPMFSIRKKKPDA
ncbi:cytochrome b/b6 domain-containing protein [Sneathiella litorea]|uniref:Cytochrome b/b6 domain-containing protein n=1 Tax=Sneathiella litorea TaxID=2606216 RepID=A0A6L8WC58_9PROT|nr:cytochrome b/b6 domain-containing protein [Sneathiella litorea]